MSIHICNIGMSWKLDVEWNYVKVDPMACVFLDQFDHFYIASTLSENLWCSDTNMVWSHKKWRQCQGGNVMWVFLMKNEWYLKTRRYRYKATFEIQSQVEEPVRFFFENFLNRNQYKTRGEGYNVQHWAVRVSLNNHGYIHRTGRWWRIDCSQSS